MRRLAWLLLGTLGLAVFGAALAAYVYEAPPRAQAAVPPRRRGRWRAVSAVGVVVMAGGLVGGAYAFDAARDQVIAPGIQAGHVDLGGLTASEAQRKLQRAYRRLYRPVTVRAGRQRFVLEPARVRLAVDVERTVERALARSRSGSFISRAVRDLARWDVDARVTPRVRFSRLTVRRFVDGVVAAVEQPPRAARVVPSASGLVFRGAEHGFDADAALLRRRLEEALADVAAPRALKVPGLKDRAKVTLAKLQRRYPAYITVDRGSFQLRLYERLKLTRTYRIAVGAIGYDTPAGLYTIQNMAVNPTWNVPTSAWTGSLAGASIPPGPSNPLKARWMGIYGGAGIHGTDQDWSLGSAASHGCIRMAIPDVVELYDRVEVGTPVYIG